MLNMDEQQQYYKNLLRNYSPDTLRKLLNTLTEYTSVDKMGDRKSIISPLKAIHTSILEITQDVALSDLFYISSNIEWNNAIGLVKEKESHIKPLIQSIKSILEKLKPYIEFKQNTNLLFFRRTDQLKKIDIAVEGYLKNRSPENEKEVNTECSNWLNSCNKCLPLYSQKRYATISELQKLTSTFFTVAPAQSSDSLKSSAVAPSPS